jgi:hypothetical protein
MIEHFVFGNTKVTITPIKQTAFIDVIDVTIECAARPVRTITTNSMQMALRIKEHAFRDEMRQNEKAK